MTRLRSHTTLFAITVIGILEGIALIQGINGASFGIALAIIAGLAGYKVRPPSK